MAGHVRGITKKTASEGQRLLSLFCDPEINVGQAIWRQHFHFFNSALSFIFRNNCHDKSLDVKAHIDRLCFQGSGKNLQICYIFSGLREDSPAIIMILLNKM
jgi:hypothetical protein